MALEDARRLERLLQARPVPTAPPQFTARAMGRLRRDRWRREQLVDLGFNLAVGVVVFSVVLAVWMLLSGSGVAEMSGEAAALLGDQLVELARRAAPSAPLYAGAAALVGSALGIWWWAERGTI